MHVQTAVLETSLGRRERQRPRVACRDRRLPYTSSSARRDPSGSLRSVEVVRAFPVPQLLGAAGDVGVRPNPNEPPRTPGERDAALVGPKIQHHVPPPHPPKPV